MTLGEIVVRLRADVGSFGGDIDRAIGSLARLGGAGKASGAAAAGGLFAVSAAAAAVAAASVKSAADFEASFAKVKRVISPAEADLGKLRKSILDLSTEIPVSAVLLADMASMAGQMGLKGEASIMRLVEVSARLGVTAEMSGEQATMMLARIAQVGGIADTEFQNLASAIVGVSSDFNATTEEVMRMTTQMQGLASQAGVSTQTMLALSATLASAGIKAEAGGTAIGRMMADIGRITQDGGSKLQALAQLMNATGEDVRKAWSEDKGGFVLKVFKELHKEGTNSIKVLDELGWKNVRVAGAAGALAKSHGELSKAMASVNEHYRNGTELGKQSDEIFKTFWSTLEKLKGAITRVAIEHGSQLLPILNVVGTALLSVVRIVGTAFEWWNRLPLPIQALLSPLHQVILLFKGLGAAFDWVMSKTGLAVSLKEIATGLVRIAVAMGQVVREAGGKLADLLGIDDRFLARMKGLVEFFGKIAGYVIQIASANIVNTLNAIGSLGRGDAGKESGKYAGRKQEGGADVFEELANTAKTRSDEATEAIKKYKEAVGELRHELTGGQAQAELKKLEAAIGTSGQISKLSAPAIAKVVTELKEMTEWGAKATGSLAPLQKGLALSTKPGDAQYPVPGLITGTPNTPKGRIDEILANAPKPDDTPGLMTTWDTDLGKEYYGRALNPEKFEEVTKATFDWNKMLAAVADTMQVLGISADSTFGKILGGMTTAASAGQNFREASDSKDIGGMAAAGAQTFGAFKGATDHRSAGRRALGGGMTTGLAAYQATSGMDFVSRGIVVGGAAIGGAVIGALSEPGWVKQAESMMREYGVGIGEELASGVTFQAQWHGFAVLVPRRVTWSPVPR